MRARALVLGVLLALPMEAGARAPDTSPRAPARPEPSQISLRAVVLAGAGTGLAASGTASVAPPLDGAVVATGAGTGAWDDSFAALPERMSERVSTLGLLISPRPPPRLTEAARIRLAAPPPPRPDVLERPGNAARALAIVPPASRLAVPRSQRPAARPDGFSPGRVIPAAAAAIPLQPDPRGITGRRGALCGDARLKGETVARIASRVQGCGVNAPVRVAEVSGLRLSRPATIDCTTAKTLADWVDGSVKPTVGRLGGGAAGLEVFASYSCRPRNNQAGAKVSEHGRGHAIDIGAIILKSGATIRVLEHWRDATLGPLLKAMHRGACGPFGTVLGPASDRFHQNHLHLDTARYRAGSYCR